VASGEGQEEIATTVYYVRSGQTATINDTTGIDGFIIEPGGEIIDSYFFGDTIDLYGLAVLLSMHRR